MNTREHCTHYRREQNELGRRRKSTAVIIQPFFSSLFHSITCSRSRTELATSTNTSTSNSREKNLRKYMWLDGWINNHRELDCSSLSLPLYTPDLEAFPCRFKSFQFFIQSLLRFRIIFYFVCDDQVKFLHSEADKRWLPTTNTTTDFLFFSMWKERDFSL